MSLFGMFSQSELITLLVKKWSGEGGPFDIEDISKFIIEEWKNIEIIMESGEAESNE